jgi:hypothetical protein
VRNRKAEEIEAVEMEGGGNYVISVTWSKLVVVVVVVVVVVHIA